MSFDENEIKRTLHSYTFPESILSFGYSKVKTNRWYVGLASGKVMYSTDGGNSFSQSSYAGTWPKGQTSTSSKRSPAIATSPIDEATVYYAATGSDFLISVDGGKNFTNHNDGLDVTRIVDLEASPNGQYIFAACAFDGAWVYAVQQNKWFKMDSTDTPKEIRYSDVQFLESENLVRFGTYGSGILDFRINEDFSTIYVAPDNFKIEVVDETCIGKNGQLKIVTKFNHNYNVTVAGIKYDFESNLNIPSLEPGSYDICIGITNTTYKHCVNLEVKASELLTGKTTIKSNKVNIAIKSGTAPYSVSVNNVKILETYNKTFSVPSKAGDIIQIESKATCEGKITKIIGASLELKAFPNPVSDYFEVRIPESDNKTVSLELYSQASGLIAKKQYPVVNNKIRVNIQDNASGVYFVRLNLKEPKTIKIIKK
jgi:hypothetical protein